MLACPKLLLRRNSSTWEQFNWVLKKLWFFTYGSLTHPYQPFGA